MRTLIENEYKICTIDVFVNVENKMETEIKKLKQRQ